MSKEKRKAYGAAIYALASMEDSVDRGPWHRRLRLLRAYDLVKRDSWIAWVESRQDMPWCRQLTAAAVAQRLEGKE